MAFAYLRHRPLCFTDAAGQRSQYRINAKWRTWSLPNRFLSPSAGFRVVPMSVTKCERGPRVSVIGWASGRLRSAVGMKGWQLAGTPEGLAEKWLGEQ